MWVILIPSLNLNVQPSQTARKNGNVCSLWRLWQQHPLLLIHPTRTWYLPIREFVFYFCPRFFTCIPSQTSNIWTHRISHPPVLLHLKALDSERTEISRGGGGNLDTGEAFYARAIKHTWCYFHLWWIIRPLIIVINQLSGSLMHSPKTLHHCRSTWAVLTYEKSMCSHNSKP